MSAPDRSSVKPVPVPSALAEPFWAALKRQDFQLQRCAKCGGYNHPPKIICPHCHGRKLEWVSVPKTGTVYSFTIVHRPPTPAFKDDVPYAVGLVDIDGTNVRLLSSLVMPPAEVHIGKRVEIMFDTVNDDITLFRFKPLAGEEKK